MKSIKRKLRSQRGETLVEVLASVLIASLSVAMLLGGVAVSVNLDRQADTSDKYFYQTLTAAENQSSPVPMETAPSIVVKKDMAVINSIPIQVYGGEGLYSYALDPTATPAPTGGTGS